MSALNAETDEQTKRLTKSITIARENMVTVSLLDLLLIENRIDLELTKISNESLDDGFDVVMQFDSDLMVIEKIFICNVDIRMEIDSKEG